MKKGNKKLYIGIGILIIIILAAIGSLGQENKQVGNLNVIQNQNKIENKIKETTNEIGNTIKNNEEKVDNTINETKENTNIKSTTQTTDKKETTNQSKPKENSRTVYIGETGTKYHLKTCSTLKGNGRAISYDEAIKQGRTACKVCKP